MVHVKLPNNYNKTWVTWPDNEWVTPMLTAGVPMVSGGKLTWGIMNDKTVLLMPRFVIGSGKSFEVIVETQLTGSFAVDGYHALALFNGNTNYFGLYAGELASDQYYYHDYAYTAPVTYQPVSIFWNSGDIQSFKITYNATTGVTNAYLAKRVGGILGSYILYATRTDGPNRLWGGPLTIWLMNYRFTGSYSVGTVSISCDGVTEVLAGAYDTYVWGGYNDQTAWNVWPTFLANLTSSPNGINFHWRETSPEGASEPGGIIVAYDETGGQGDYPTQIGSETILGATIQAGSTGFGKLKLWGKQASTDSRTKVRVVDPNNGNTPISNIPAAVFGDNTSGFYPPSGFANADIVDLRNITQSEIVLEVTSSNTDGSTLLNFIGNGFDGWLTTLYGFEVLDDPYKVTVSLEEGTYSGVQTVSLSDQLTDSSLKYTLNGSNPIVNGSVYLNPIIVSETLVINAVVEKEGTYGEVQSFNYNIIPDIKTLFFDEQPTSSSNVIHYSTFEQGVVQTQNTQTEASNGNTYVSIQIQQRQSQSQNVAATLNFNGTLISNQVKQTESIIGQKINTGLIASSQVKQTSIVSSKLNFIGVNTSVQSVQTQSVVLSQSITGFVSSNQSKQSNVALGSSGVTTLAFSQQPTSVDGIIYYGTEDLTVVLYQADVIQLTKQQQEIANGLLKYEGSVSQSKKDQQVGLASQLFTSVVSNTTAKNSQNSISELKFEFNVTQVSKTNTQNIFVDNSDTKSVLQEQVKQSQIIESRLIFEGVISNNQRNQLQLSKKIAELQKYKVTMSDPLQLLVFERDPLLLKTSKSDPLQLFIK